MSARLGFGEAPSQRPRGCRAWPLPRPTKAGGARGTFFRVARAVSVNRLELGPACEGGEGASSEERGGERAARASGKFSNSNNA